ncbi:MAG TPA: hypothetical protein VFE17_00560 [Candidatus Baltobacteraceae bacterium]|nr:hypothetical protein [Candidatus Baltobacteraceae bacterium]
MSTWHVWGDYIHTRPERIGEAKLTREDDAARENANAGGFDFDLRVRRGFEPWAAVFTGEDDADQDAAFANCPIVRGWQRVE